VTASHRSLAEALERLGSVSDRGYRFVLDDKFNERFVSFGDLVRITTTLAAGLQEIGLRKG